MTKLKNLRSKICLVGGRAVGKTSLIRRFVLDMYDDHYISTLGTKVSKKVVEVPRSEHDLVVRLDLAIWDIMGQPGFRELLEDASLLPVSE